MCGCCITTAVKLIMNARLKLQHLHALIAKHLMPVSLKFAMRISHTKNNYFLSDLTQTCTNVFIMLQIKLNIKFQLNLSRCSHRPPMHILPTFSNVMALLKAGEDNSWVHQKLFCLWLDLSQI